MSGNIVFVGMGWVEKICTFVWVKIEAGAMGGLDF